MGLRHYILNKKEVIVMYEVRLGSYYANSHPIMTIYFTGSEEYCATELTFTKKANEIGTLEMTIPPQNIKYNDIKDSEEQAWYGLGCYIEVLKDQDELNPLWNGIVTGIEKDMFGQLHITAYDMLYVTQFQVLPTQVFQNQSYQYIYQWLELNNNRDAGNGQIINSNFMIEFNTPYPATENFPELNTEDKTTFEALQDLAEENAVFYSVYQPFMSTPCVKIYVRTDGSASFNTQKIELGSNMLDYSSLNSTDGWLTSIAPVSEDANGNVITIQSVTQDGSGYLKLSDEIIKKYGERRAKVKFEGITNPNELMGYGQHYLITHALPSFTIDASAFDLGLVNLETEFEVGLLTRIVIKPFGLSTNAMCTEKTTDCMNPEQTKLTLSNVIISTLTQKISRLQKG